MLKALTKTRPAKFYSNQVKFLLLIVIAVLFWNSNDARRFTADRLNDAAEVIRPANNEIRISFWTMTISADELFTLKENYINHIIDGMDMDTLCQMCFDLLLDAYEDSTWDELTEEIKDLYDEDTLIDLLPQGNNQWSQSLPSFFSLSQQWLASTLFKQSNNFKMTNYPDSVKMSHEVLPTMKCARTSNDIIRRYSSVESDGDWDDILTPDDYEEYIERRQYERGMRY